MAEDSGAVFVGDLAAVPGDVFGFGIGHANVPWSIGLMRVISGG